MIIKYYGNQCFFNQSNMISHSGIKNMRWGVRRFQNKDGTLTEEGKKRYYAKRASIEKEHNEQESIRKTSYKLRGKENDYKYNEIDIDNETQRQLREDTKKEYKDIKNKQLNSTQNLLYDSSKLLNDSSKLLPTGNGKVVRPSYKNLSDEELIARINRLNLEQRYSSLKGDSKYVKSGSEKAREILQTIGAVVAIGASGIAIAKGVSDIKNNNKNLKELKDVTK